MGYKKGSTTNSAWCRIPVIASSAHIKEFEEEIPKKVTIYVTNSKKKEYTKMFRNAELSKKVKIKAIKDMKK